MSIAPPVSAQKKKEGISFVCRCHNEQDVLAKSLKSLANISRPYEIILVLHRCTDNSKAIGEELAKELPIKIFEYTMPTSRAGYENLVTDVSDPHSFAAYTTWCFEKASFKWKFKWDADFQITPELVQFINNDGIFEEEKDTIVYLPAKNLEAVNYEPYLFNCFAKYGKYVFWEIPLFNRGYRTVKIEHGVIHCSSLKIVKPYWKHTPWFMTDIEDGKIEEDGTQKTAEEEKDRELRKELTRRYKVLVELYGEEPVGACRANDDQCARAFHLCKQQKEKLEKEKIFLEK